MFYYRKSQKLKKKSKVLEIYFYINLTRKSTDSITIAMNSINNNNDSTNKLLINHSNNFEYKNNCLNGRIDTLIDSKQLSSSKCDEDSSKQKSPKNSNSRFSKAALVLSQSPDKIEISFDGIYRRSVGNINKKDDSDDDSDRRNRASLSPSHKKSTKVSEIYKLAIMNQKKKNEGNDYKI